MLLRQSCPTPVVTPQPSVVNRLPDLFTRSDRHSGYQARRASSSPPFPQSTARQSVSRKKLSGILRPNQVLPGELMRSDRYSSSLRSRFNDYELQGFRPGQHVELKATSGEVDLYLELIDAQTGKTLLYGDDVDTFDSDARIAFTVKPGTRYHLRVSRSTVQRWPKALFLSKDLGQYGLRSRTFPSPPGRFNFFSGYGLVNAAAAVAQSIAQPTFADVPALGGAKWALDRVKAPAVWNQGFTGQGVVVAVLDSGVDYTHPDLRDTLWQNRGEIAGNGLDDDQNGFVDDLHGWDFIAQDNDPMEVDAAGHGTVVAGIIAASGAKRAKGVAYNAQIMPIRVLRQNDGDIGTAFEDGIRYAVDNGAKIINLSLAIESANGWLKPLSPERKAALQYARDAGVMVIAAAGNQRQDFGLGRPTEPGHTISRGLGLAVGAIDRQSKLADFSNPAGARPVNYVVAPGVNLLSTSPWGGYGTWYEGTSFAAPVVSGIAALMLSANPQLTPAQMESILTATAHRRAVDIFP